ncbi:hypothetical protein AB0I37_27865 [Micromonospora purpureochromogenes]|uniref:hypothetical protein n=1 Tax=Micromonospora purpureochromogenes TaxID=47872 RepID=UPI0033C2A207
MTSRLVGRRNRRYLQVAGQEPVESEWSADAGTGVPAAPAGVAERRHEALVCVRLTAATPGSRLLDFLRGEPCAVGAWWIAADIDAVVRLSSPSRTALHRAVADLRRRGGAEVVAVHTILRPLQLGAAGPVAQVGAGA